MDRRSKETPMDFTYDNGTGPIDSRSPFAQYARDHRPAKRPFSAFNSPTKNPSSAFPNLQPAANQHVLFSDMPPPPTPSANKPLPPTPFRSDLFTTPRKPAVDFSSGGETPETPNNADSEATPDNMPFKFHGATETKTKSPRKKRDSIFSKLWKGSPGKGEMVMVRPYSKNGERRVAKRRARAAELSPRKRHGSRHRTDEDSDVEEITKEDFSSKQTQQQQKPGLHPVASFLSYLESHPTLPHILSFYAQLALNLFLIFGCMYILYSFWSTIRSDVDDKAREATAGILVEMAVCAKDWRENGCDDAGGPKPALKLPCEEWFRCMNRDPKKVGRARVSAHTFAEIFNSFIEPISYKAMVFSLMFTFGLIILCNFAFSFIRRQQANDPYMQHYAAVPPTPQRQPSGGHYGMYTPYQQPLMSGNQPMGLEPAPSGRPVSGEDRGSPTKMLDYR